MVALISRDRRFGMGLSPSNDDGMQCVRLVNLVTGLCSASPPPLPPPQVEPDAASVEAHQDSYFALFAALLNVSVLRSAQPLIAQRGLQVGQGQI